MNALELNEPSRPPRSMSDPDPEVPEKARRRTFTVPYELGEIGVLLRREGLKRGAW